MAEPPLKAFADGRTKRIVRTGYVSSSTGDNQLHEIITISLPQHDKYEWFIEWFKAKKGVTNAGDVDLYVYDQANQLLLPESLPWNYDAISLFDEKIMHHIGNPTRVVVKYKTGTSGVEISFTISILGVRKDVEL